MNPDDPKTQNQIQLAYKGLGQLRMYDTVQLVSENSEVHFELHNNNYTHNVRVERRNFSNCCLSFFTISEQGKSRES